VPGIDWSKSISITWDEKRREDSVVQVPGIKVPAGPPAVRTRRARWELSSSYPRVFGAAYRFPLDSVAVNRGLKDERGRTLVARDLDEPSGQMPLAVIGWHLPQRPDASTGQDRVGGLGADRVAHRLDQRGELILTRARGLHGLLREPSAHVLLDGRDQRVSDA
jgi:hypothetical protein